MNLQGRGKDNEVERKRRNEKQGQQGSIKEIKAVYE